MADCIYLRKSRVDSELEAQGGDTLLRHEQILLQHAALQGRSISRIYRELVSGETIAARPQMQALLHDVAEGAWDAVHVMEIERLARGDTLDQGLVAQHFRYSNTQIITPQRIYDPGNEFDEEYFEFGLFMSRREYKTINRRQQAGRRASVCEGKWPSNKAPYGYERVRLEGERGWTLRPHEPEASVLRDIFRWLTVGCSDASGNLLPLGTGEIANRLRALGIPSPLGGTWSAAVLRELLRNPAYVGQVRWGGRAQQKTLVDGKIKLSRPRAAPQDCLCVPGLHPPLVSQDCFARAQAQLCARATSRQVATPAMKNPLSGLLFCALCGHAMTRRAYQNTRPAALLCPSADCPTMASALPLVEENLLVFLARHLRTLPPLSIPQSMIASEERASLVRNLDEIKRKLHRLALQEQRLCELLEEGTYSTADFKARRSSLAEQKETAKTTLAKLQLEQESLAARADGSEYPLPPLQHVLDIYPLCRTAQEKNHLLRLLLEKVDYQKTEGGRYQTSNLSLCLYPRV